MSSQKVLVINTYGGSLLLGAKAAKAEVIATMEDVGFGSDLQALNFPDIPRYEKRAGWPEKFGTSWKSIDVVAHPPCAAFSVQNSGNAKLRGTNTDAFHCHTEVMDYALGHHCRSLAIESVMGAYEGGHEAYEEAALKYGYRVNYLMVNSASFRVPQWRERVWTIFHQVPKRHPFKVDFKPHYVTLGSILNPNGTEWLLGNSNVAKIWAKVSLLITKKWPIGCSIMKAVQDVYNIPNEPNFRGARERFGFSGFITSHPKLIDPAGFSPVILFDLFLADGRRRLTIEEYAEIMGFPRDYKWGKRQKQFRMYLSKGVVPAVAAWILKIVDCNASGWVGKHTHSEEDFGGVIDLRPKKADALAEARR